MSKTPKTKVCSKCGIRKPIEEYNKKGKGRRQSYCRKCQRKYFKKFYKANKKSELSRVRRGRKARTEKAIEYVNAIKAAGRCSDCRRKFPPVAMDFDHVYGKKTKEIAILVGWGTPVDKIKKEIDKCELVCANCHRIRSFTKDTHNRASSNGRT